MNDLNDIFTSIAISKTAEEKLLYAGSRLLQQFAAIPRNSFDKARTKKTGDAYFEKYCFFSTENVSFPMYLEIEKAQSPRKFFFGYGFEPHVFWPAYYEDISEDNLRFYSACIWLILRASITEYSVHIFGKEFFYEINIELPAFTTDMIGSEETYKKLIAYFRKLQKRKTVLAKILPVKWVFMKKYQPWIE